MEARAWEASEEREERASLGREMGQSVYLLGLMAFVNGAVLGVGLLAVRALG